MRRAAANGSKDGGAQANQALDKLRDAQKKLERNQSGRGERDDRTFHECLLGPMSIGADHAPKAVTRFFTGRRSERGSSGPVRHRH